MGAKLAEAGARLEGLQRSFECIQDFVRAYSPALWHDEFSRFVRCAMHIFASPTVPSLNLAEAAGDQAFCGV